MESKTQKALELFYAGNNCAQAMLLAHAEEIGLTNEQAKKLTACLGGGMCVGDICGAISAGMLVLGMRHFDPAGDPPAEKVKTRKIGMDFMNALKKEYGITDCRDIFSQGGRAACMKVTTSVEKLLEEKKAEE